MKEEVKKSREEFFAESQFEWIRTERSGDICHFDRFDIDGGIEYTVFTDNSRIKSDLIGDVVLMHSDTSQILGKDLLAPKTDRPIEDILGIPVDTTHLTAPPQTRVEIESENSAVVAILEKSKKKSERINLSLTVKIPSPDLYAVIKENFDNVDDVLLQSVMEQIDTRTLRESIKKELVSIYQKKRKAQ